jgi:hypothetical protein
MDLTYTEPRSIEEAQKRRGELIESIQHIEAQLGDRERKKQAVLEGGVPYPLWRSRAVYALQFRSAELRRVKDWLQKAKANASPLEGLLQDIYSRMRLLADTIREMARQNDALKRKLASLERGDDNGDRTTH